MRVADFTSSEGCSCLAPSPTQLHERVYIRILELLGLAVQDRFHAAVGEVCAEVFGSDFGGFGRAPLKSYARMSGGSAVLVCSAHYRTALRRISRRHPPRAADRAEFHSISCHSTLAIPFCFQGARKNAIPAIWGP